jgi:hypothetical protein
MMFHLAWLQITRLEGAVLYSGCPIDFGTLAIHEDSFMDVFTSVCLKVCSEDHECEISDLLENLIVFPSPQAILDRIRGTDYCESATALVTFTRWVSIPSRRALQLSGWQEFSPSKSPQFGLMGIGCIDPEGPQQRNLEDFFQTVIGSKYEFDEPLGMGALAPCF